MKKIVMLILAIIMSMSLLTGCSDTVEGNKNYAEHTGFVEIAGKHNLYYDPDTKIVYVVFNEQDEFGYKGYGYMSAYYAPNGLPYTYDVATGTLVEIGTGTGR